jgi:hypothetical protein
MFLPSRVAPSPQLDLPNPLVREPAGAIAGRNGSASPAHRWSADDRARGARLRRSHGADGLSCVSTPQLRVAARRPGCEHGLFHTRISATPKGDRVVARPARARAGAQRARPRSRANSRDGDEAVLDLYPRYGRRGARYVVFASRPPQIVTTLTLKSKHTVQQVRHAATW